MGQKKAQPSCMASRRATCNAKSKESKASSSNSAEDSLCELRQDHSIILFVLGRLTDSPVEIQGSLKAFNCLTKICHAI